MLHGKNAVSNKKQQNSFNLKNLYSVNVLWEKNEVRQDKNKYTPTYLPFSGSSGDSLLERAVVSI